MKTKEGPESKTKHVLFGLPVNVQNTYESMLLSRNLQRCVDAVDNAVEQMGVDLLRQGISGIYRSLLGHGFHHRFCHQNDPPVAQPTHQVVCPHTQQLTEDCQVRIAGLQDAQIKLLL